MKTKKRAVIDTSSIYVRGEENLGEWKPRGISLLDEHQSHLDKLERIQEVRAVSHSRLLRFRACASLSDVYKVAQNAKTRGPAETKSG